MSTARERRGLVPLEIALVLAIAVVPLGGLPVALPLIVAATASRWLRGRGWGDVAVVTRDRLVVGLATGVAAIALALAVGGPLVESLGTRAVEWSTFPIVRGNASQLLPVAIIVATIALAMELALRGWLVERVLELSPGGPVLPVLCGAIAEAVVTPGGLGVRIGAGLFGIGLGWMYCASGRDVIAPILARVTFQVGLLVLEALRLIG